MGLPHRIGAFAAAVAALALALAWSTPADGPVAEALTVGALSVPAALARGAFFLPLFTRLSRDALLDGGVRPRIVELLKHEPGLGIVDVCDRLQIGWGTAVHHLTRLEAAGLLVSQDAGRRRRFFLPGDSATRRTAVCILSTDLNRRLLEYIRDHPGTSQSQTCGALGVSAPLAHKYLSRLIGARLVRVVRQWRTVQYYADESVSVALAEFAQVRGEHRAEGPPSPP